MNSNRTHAQVLAIVVCAFASRTGQADCPSNLVDQLVPSTAWDSPYQAALGVSLDSSYGVGAIEYLLSAVDPRPSVQRPVRLFRYSGSNHSQLGNSLQGNNPNVSVYNWLVEAAATLSGTSVVWGVAWEGDAADDWYVATWLRRFSSSLGALANEVMVLSKTLHPAFSIGASIDAIPGTSHFVVGSLAALPGGGTNHRPYIRIVSAAGSTVLAETLVDGTSGYNASDVAVDAFSSPVYGNLIAVSWTETNTTTSRTQGRFKVLYPSGSMLPTASGTIPATQYYDVADIRIAGVGSSLVAVWDYHHPYARMASDSYFQTFPLVNVAVSYGPARKVDAYTDYATYKPDVSADRWTAATGTTYTVYSISHNQVVSDCPTTDGFCLYPMINLFKNLSTPVEVVGPQFLSVYSQGTINSITDGVKTEVFVGCSDRVVFGGVYYSNANFGPSSQWGLRRSFFSVSGNDVRSSLLSSAVIGGEDGSVVGDFDKMAPEGFGYREDAFEALMNGGYVVAPALLSDAESFRE